MTARDSILNDYVELSTMGCVSNECRIRCEEAAVRQVEDYAHELAEKIRSVPMDLLMPFGFHEGIQAAANLIDPKVTE